MFFGATAGTTQSDSGSDYKCTEVPSELARVGQELNGGTFPCAFASVRTGSPLDEPAIYKGSGALNAIPLRVHFFYYRCILKKLSGPARLLRLHIEELCLQEETGCSVHLLELPAVLPRQHSAETAPSSRLCTQ